LEAICDGLGITLSQFFAEEDMVELTPELRDLFDAWKALSPEKKKLALQVLRAFEKE